MRTETKRTPREGPTSRRSPLCPITQKSEPGLYGKLPTETSPLPIAQPSPRELAYWSRAARRLLAGQDAAL